MATYGTTYSDWLKQNPGIVEQAMARTGASAPPPAEQPASYQAPPPPAPVQAPQTRNPYRALAQVQGQQVEAQNEVAASHLREGDAKARAAQSRSDTIATATPKARRYADAAEQVHDDNRIRQEKALKWMDEDMQTLRQPPVEQKAWQKAVSIISGIVGAAAQGYLGDMGAGVAYGMAALQDHVNKGVNDQLEAKDQAGDNLAATEKYLETLGKDSADELDIGSKLVANHWFATGKELERIAEQAKVPEYQETAQRLALEAQSRGRAILAQNYEQQIAQARAAAAARAKAKTNWGQYSVSQLEAWEKSGQLPVDGVNALNEARKKAREGQGDKQPIEGEIFPGYVSSQSLNASSDAKARTIYSAGASIKSDLARLAEMRARNGGGTWNREDVKEASAIINTLPSRYSQMFGSGAPNNTELELFGSYLVDPTDYQLTGLDPIESYKRLAQQVDRTADAQLAAFGINRAPGGAGVNFTADAPPTAPAPAASAPSRITMYGPNGEVRQVKPGLVKQYEANGFTASPPASAPAAPDVREMSNADYEAYARRESGY